MTDTAILAEGLSKKYHIGAIQRSSSLRDVLADAITAPARRIRNMMRGTGSAAELNDTIWALKEIGFEVKTGEVLGVIGLNGSGKSTLLKILARVTEPSEGFVRIHGRVGSLLEVGTGFHAELTGRENVFLNGAILGMPNVEIRRKFDEIVDFSGVEKFIDTPVKHYSSGMYMRLAFAVAAHMEPDILLVDEVLAVGDVKFQEKCLNKMRTIGVEGRTVLFVSHNLAALQQLCTRAMLLESGRCVFQGAVDQTVMRYLHTQEQLNTIELGSRRDRQGTQALKFTRVGFFDGKGTPQDWILTGQDLRIRFYYEAPQAAKNPSILIGFNVVNEQGLLITNLNSRDVGKAQFPVAESGYFECVWPHFNLRSGTYTCALYCEMNGQVADWLQSAFQLRVVDGDFFGTGSLLSRSVGDVLVEHEWSAEQETQEPAAVKKAAYE